MAAEVRPSVGGVAAEVLSAGPAPGFVGLPQVNLLVPAEAASETAAIELTVGGASTQPNVTAAIE